MIVTTINGNFDTENAYRQCNNNTKDFEEFTRRTPGEVFKLPLGYIIPLGTMGNAMTKQDQFKSNFHIIAYALADELIDRTLDFEDFNIRIKNESGKIIKSINKLNTYVENKLGSGWKVTIFNVSISTSINSMCNGVDTVESIDLAISEYEKIVMSRIDGLSKSNELNPWKHEIIELFYDYAQVMSSSFRKIMSKDKKECIGIGVELLVYDSYANGLRLLFGVDSFTSSKIRMHNADSNIYTFVLKARIKGRNVKFKPVRRFSGKSNISDVEVMSGCSERIAYNIVNKNYRHWSFISLPEDLRIPLSEVRDG